MLSARREAPPNEQTTVRLTIGKAVCMKESTKEKPWTAANHPGLEASKGLARVRLW